MLAYAPDPRIQEMEDRRTHKQDLHTMSKARVSQWTNTIQGFVAQR